MKEKTKKCNNHFPNLGRQSDHGFVPINTYLTNLKHRKTKRILSFFIAFLMYHGFIYAASNSSQVNNDCIEDLCPNDPNKTAPGNCGCGVVETSNCQTSGTPRSVFDKSKDILIAQFDSKPDPDDIHSQAALGSMLRHTDLEGVNYFAVAGAYGIQSGNFIDSDILFNMAFGSGNWTDADADWSGSVTKIANKVIPILQNGGKVWVQEAGQSDITADWVKVIQSAVGNTKVKDNVIVVQHSEWNQNQTTNADLDYVRENTNYFYIDDGNVPINDNSGDHGPWSTPEYRSRDQQWLNMAESSPNVEVRDLWIEAERVIAIHYPDGVPYDWSWMKNGGIDFSDCSENWWILSIGENANTVEKFFNRYVTNTTNQITPNPGSCNQDNCTATTILAHDFTNTTVNGYDPSEKGTVPNVPSNGINFGEEVIGASGTNGITRPIAAEVTYDGSDKEAIFTVTIVGEPDGESTYEVFVNDLKVGERQASRIFGTSIAPYTYEDLIINTSPVSIQSGDVIRVTSDHVSNNLVPEGDGFATARGRWRSLSISCVNVDLNTPINIPGIVEAEDYTSQFGIEIETTTDVGGGNNIGFIENGDFVEFNVSVASTTDYTVTARIASLNDGGIINLLLDGVEIGEITVPTTDGWQNWQDATTTVSLTSGDKKLRLEFEGESDFLFNLNKVEFTTNGMIDLCPDDPNKTEPGNCGCGVEESLGCGITNDCNGFEEENGLLVIEAENLPIEGTDWSKETIFTGYTGESYIIWKGNDAFNDPGGVGVIETPIKINKAGIYRVQWRNKVGLGDNSTEHNDTWLKFPDADDFYGEEGGSRVYPKGSGRTPEPEGAGGNGWFKIYLNGTTDWTWSTFTSDFDPHSIFVEFDNPGVYTLQIAGRSKEHAIDRIVLSNDANDPLNLSNDETGCGINNPITFLPVPGTIEAEDYSSQFGIQTETTSDVNGDQNVGFIENNDYTEYGIDVASDGVYNMNFRVSSSTTGGTISIFSNDNMVGSITIDNTGGWHSWENVATNVDLPKGEQTLRLEYSGTNNDYLFNLNYIEVTPEAITSVTEQVSAHQLNVFPNPVENIVYIKGWEEGITWKLIDIRSVELMTGDTEEVTMTELPSGSYFIIFSNNQISKIMKR